MRRRQPGLPITVSGGLRNPLGAKALYLGNSIYRIHGTNNKRSIGRASSSGCFRMMNKHVNHLAKIARIGTKVRVVSSYCGRRQLRTCRCRHSSPALVLDDEDEAAEEEEEKAQEVTRN